jgi:sulfur carrier protein ThiS
MKNKNSIISITNILADSNDIVADIVKYSEAKGALATLRDSIKARLHDLASNAGVTLADAAKPLRAALVAEGMDKRRVSEVLLELGIRERVAVKNEKRAVQSSRFDKEAVKLAQSIRKGHKLADAVAIARRAYIILRDSK